jgi:hypothetical protein
VTSFVTWIKPRNTRRNFFQQSYKKQEKVNKSCFLFNQKRKYAATMERLSFIWPQRFIARNLLISTHPRTIVFLAFGHETVFLCH